MVDKGFLNRLEHYLQEKSNAEIARDTGISKQLISKIRKGQANLTLVKLYSLFNVYDTIDLNYLFRGNKMNVELSKINENEPVYKTSYTKFNDCMQQLENCKEEISYLKKIIKLQNKVNEIESNQ